MINYLVFEDECDFSFLPRMGGGACLPPEFEWPKDKDGEPMLHLMVLPSNLINSYMSCNLPETYCVSVFIPYKKDSIDYIIDLARRPETALVFAHKIADEIRQECANPLLPAHSINIDCDEDAEDEDEFSDEIESKIGGGGTWLQDRIEMPDQRFLLQLLGSMFNKYWPSHKGMFMGGVAYLFINKDCDFSQTQFGRFTVQYT